MAEFRLIRITSPMDWLRVRILYGRAFPREERKPFSVIRKMHRRGKTDIWVLQRDGRFAGFAATINGDDLVLLDYLAIEEKQRGQGAGSTALAALMQAYYDRRLFVEIEDAFSDGPGQALRQRRRAFYLRAGFTSCRTMVTLFGVPMELLGHGCSLDFDAYHQFYCTNYSAWAGEHVKPLPWPENAGA